MASSNFTQLTLEPLIACIQDRIQHGLMQQVEAHPLADYDVNLVRELHVLNSLVYHLDDVTQPIMRDQNGRMAGDAARFHCKHSLRTWMGQKSAHRSLVARRHATSWHRDLWLPAVPAGTLPHRLSRPSSPALQSHNRRPAQLCPG